MGLSMRAEVDARDIARVVRVLRAVEPSLVAELRTSMRSGVLPIAKMLEGRVNQNAAPMSGMNRRGVTKPNRLRWAKGAATVSVTPGYSKKSPNLVTIAYRVPKTAVGLAVAENAGSKSAGNSPQGRAFIRQITTVVPGWPDGGRYLFRSFMPYRPHVFRLAENILMRWVDKTNRELESR